jgi:hypothetical protein
MGKNAFKEIMAEFPPRFVVHLRLVEKLSRVLFPIRDEALFTGTYRDPDKLHKPTIDTFDQAIAKYIESDPG